MRCDLSVLELETVKHPEVVNWVKNGPLGDILPPLSILV